MNPFQSPARYLVVVGAVLAATACSSSDETSENGGQGGAPGTDASADVATDALPDAPAADAPEDAPSDAPAEGASEASVDAPGEASVDAMPDAAEDAPPIEAGPDAPPSCPPPPNFAGPPDVVLAPQFAPFYATYDLGPVPGTPANTRLGGCVIRHDDDSKLLIAVDSETAYGSIYEAPVVRDACGHIIAFAGDAVKIADTPYVDANLVYGPEHVLFYTGWPVNELSQLLPGAASPAVTTSLSSLGVGGGGPGGLGFVPPGVTAAGGMRIITWSAGYWYHLTYTKQGSTYAISNPVQTATLPNGPGGFAYIPQGSPGFATQHIIMAEWSTNSVAIYEADDQGDPIVSTRDAFYTTFPRPWGAYFEPVTGDYLLLTWGTGTDRVFIVQGFSPPDIVF